MENQPPESTLYTEPGGDITLIVPAGYQLVLQGFNFYGALVYRMEKLASVTLPEGAKFVPAKDGVIELPAEIPSVQAGPSPSP